MYNRLHVVYSVIKFNKRKLLIKPLGIFALIRSEKIKAEENKRKKRQKIALKHSTLTLIIILGFILNNQLEFGKEIVDKEKNQGIINNHGMAQRKKKLLLLLLMLAILSLVDEMNNMAYGTPYPNVKFYWLKHLQEVKKQVFALREVKRFKTDPRRRKFDDRLQRQAVFSIRTFYFDLKNIVQAYPAKGYNRKENKRIISRLIFTLYKVCLSFHRDMEDRSLYKNKSIDFGKDIFDKMFNYCSTQHNDYFQLVTERTPMTLATLACNLLILPYDLVLELYMTVGKIFTISDVNNILKSYSSKDLPTTWLMVVSMLVTFQHFPHYNLNDVLDDDWYPGQFLLWHKKSFNFNRCNLIDSCLHRNDDRETFLVIFYFIFFQPLISDYDLFTIYIAKIQQVIQHFSLTNESFMLLSFLLKSKEDRHIYWNVLVPYYSDSNGAPIWPSPSFLEHKKTLDEIWPKPEDELFLLSDYEDDIDRDP